MSVIRYEERSEIHLPDMTNLVFQELEEERALLEQQRRHLNDQRILLDLERAELEQQMAALQLHYAFLDELATRLDQQEAMLASDAEVIRMTGKRLSFRLLKR
jgi:hypothetical protein